MLYMQIWRKPGEGKNYLIAFVASLTYQNRFEPVIESSHVKYPWLFPGLYSNLFKLVVVRRYCAPQTFLFLRLSIRHISTT